MRKQIVRPDEKPLRPDEPETAQKRRIAAEGADAARSGPSAGHRDVVGWLRDSVKKGKAVPRPWK